MLFTLYTKISDTTKAVQIPANISSYRSVLVLLILIILPSCSINTKETPPIDNTAKNITDSERDKDNKELEKISKDITDMVSVSVSSNASKQAEKLSEPSQSSTTNKYAEQEATKMIGVPLTVIKKYQSALLFMGDKQWQAATNIFDEIIVQHPELSGSYVNKAIIFQQQNKDTLAFEQVEKAILANDTNPYAHHLKGQLLKEQGKFERAEQSYKKALDIWPNYADAQLNMAILLELYRGKLQRAYAFYQSYLTLQPDDEKVKRWLAALNIKLKREGLTPTKQATEVEGVH